MMAKQVGALELLDCKVSPLGCEFLGKLFHPSVTTNTITILKLDHNPIGSEGVANLAEGLANNK